MWVTPPSAAKQLSRMLSNGTDSLFMHTQYYLIDLKIQFTLSSVLVLYWLIAAAACAPSSVILYNIRIRCLDLASDLNSRRMAWGTLLKITDHSKNPVCNTVILHGSCVHENDLPQLSGSNQGSDKNMKTVFSQSSNPPRAPEPVWSLCLEQPHNTYQSH